MQLANYLDLLRVAEQELADGLRAIGGAHPDEPDVRLTTDLLAGWSEHAVEVLQPFCDRYRGDAPRPPEALHARLFDGPREGGLGLLRDLHDVYLQASSADLTWSLVGQAAKANRDRELDAAVQACRNQTARTLQWLRTTLKTSAPQALVVA